METPDYKLDHGFLKQLACGVLKDPMHETTRLPVFVQVTKMYHEVGQWTSYLVTDGECELKECGFVSKQARPERFSILKITKVWKLPLDVSSYIDGRHVHLGQIEFDVEVSGENIGYSLYLEDKYINMEEMIELRDRNDVEGMRGIPMMALAKSFESSNPNERLTRYLWENRAEKFCDVSFSFENESVVVYAHKSVLMSISDVSKAHFENEGFNDNKLVHLVDTNVYSFNKFLEFVYTGKVQFTNWKLAFQLLYLSKKYLAPQLEKICQRVIMNYCDFSGENVLKVFNENHKVNDKVIKKYIENTSVPSQIRDVIGSEYFLNCDFSTIQWILSMNHLRIDEWSLLCAVYKWAAHNGSHAFCHRMEDEKWAAHNGSHAFSHRMEDEAAHSGSHAFCHRMEDEKSQNMECLHEVLEYIHFERIDMMLLKRFFKLPKLGEIVNISELEQHIFDGLLEDQSYFEQYGMATNGYSKYRGFNSERVHAEILIGNPEETHLKDIRSQDGPVLGFKVKVEPNDLAAGEHSLDLIISFQYLYSLAQVDDGAMHINIRAIPNRSREKEIIEVSWDEMELRKGEWHQVKLHLSDYRGYLSDKIENFDIETAGETKKDKVLSLEIWAGCFSTNPACRY